MGPTSACVRTNGGVLPPSDEFKDEDTGDSEWVWGVVDSCDDEEGVLFGRLDNEPMAGTGLRLGGELAVSYEKVVEHRKASDFGEQWVIGCTTRRKEARLRLTSPLRESLKVSSRPWHLAAAVFRPVSPVLSPM